MKYPFRTKPYRHQLAMMRKAFDQFREGNGVAFLAEPRTGKTKATIDTIAAMHMRYGIKKALIVAPNRILGVWVQEIAMHAPINVQTIVWDRRARKEPIPRMQTAFDMQILVTNYETFGTPGRRTKSGRRSKANGRFKHRQLIRKWLTDETHPIGVLDEGHKIKSPSGMAANMIVSMRDMFPYRMLLTGTPITKANRAHDIYMQWQWVNPDRFARWGPTVESFKAYTGVWTTRSTPIPVWRRERPRGMKALQAGLHADGIVVRRDECFDLPERLPDRIIPIRLSPKTGRHYDEMAQDMVTELESGEIVEAAIPLVVTLRLSQITSGFVGIREAHPTNPDKMVSRAVRVGTEKLAALKELLTEETLETEEPVIICARFQPDLNAIERLCARLGIPSWSIRGGRTRSDTDAALKAFKRGAGARAMVVQPSAGGVGLDMSVAPHMIWYSLIPSWVDFTQMNDRNALNQHGTRATYLLAENTVDRLIYDVLQLDGDVSKAILRNPKSILRRSTRRR